MTFPYDLRLVVHAYGARLPLYADCLRFQIASLLLNPPKCRMLLTVFCAYKDDDPVASVLADVPLSHWWQSDQRSVEVQTCPQPLGQLFRRCIGRHLASQEDQAAVLFYTDADYIFGPGCLDAVAAIGPTAGLCYPQTVLRSRSHEAGAMQIELAQGEKWPAVDPRLFVASRENRALGGLQIIGAEAAKKHGYLGGTSWMEPCDPALGFSNFRDDSKWRRSLPYGYGKAIEVPSLYRIRHAEAGHNVDRITNADA